MDVSVEVDILAPKDLVWDAVTNIDQWEGMISGIMSLEILHRPVDGLIGLKWSETRKVFGKVSTETMWVTDAEDLSFYRTRAENQGAIYISNISLTEIGDATRLTQSFSMSSDTIFSKLITLVMGAMLKRSLRKLILADVNDIKAFVESRGK